MTTEQWTSLFIVLHRVLVILDDWVCEHSPAAPLNRKPKGKYEELRVLAGDGHPPSLG
jgi:hypothetical protein